MRCNELIALLRIDSHKFAQPWTARCVLYRYAPAHHQPLLAFGSTGILLCEANVVVTENGYTKWRTWAHDG